MTRNWEEIAVNRNLDTLVKATGDWRREKQFVTGWENFPEKLMLIITELKESTDSFDQSYNDDRPVPSTHEPSLSTGIDMENLIEEWIDVSVRTIDLIEACGLTIPKSIIDIICQERLNRISFEENNHIIENIGLYTVNTQMCWACCEHLASAMETFRDISMDELLAKKEQARVAVISIELSLVLLESYFAVEDLDESWWDAYALKMEKNEARQTKHGRQR